MRRRDLLATLPPVLAGCTALPGVGEFQRRRVSLVTADGFPSTVPFSLSMADGHTDATPDQQATFDVELANDSERYWELEFWETPVDSLYITTTDSGYFVAPGNWGPSGTDGRKQYCWTPKRDFGAPTVARTVRLPPGDTHRGTVALWDDSGGDDCWPTGEFRLDGELTLNGSRCSAGVDTGERPPLEDCTGERFDFEWGFEFEVSDLD